MYWYWKFILKCVYGLANIYIHYTHERKHIVNEIINVIVDDQWPYLIVSCLYSQKQKLNNKQTKIVYISNKHILKFTYESHQKL